MNVKKETNDIIDSEEYHEDSRSRIPRWPWSLTIDEELFEIHNLVFECPVLFSPVRAGDDVVLPPLLYSWLKSGSLSTRTTP